jgi:phosphate transport system permease protein
VSKRQISNAFWEAFIKVCGWSSSLLVVIIVLFLFSEGISTFSYPPLQEGLVAGVAPSNPVQVLSPEALRQLAYGDAPNWQQAGGDNQPAFVLGLHNLEKVLKKQGLVQERAEELLGERFEHLPTTLDSILRTRPETLLLFPEEYLPSTARKIKVQNVQLSEFLAGSNWKPAENPSPVFGALPLLWGTLLVTVVAILFALLLGPPAAIYLAELANKRTHGILKPMIELIAGIPSVVFGFIGLVVVVPAIRRLFDLDSGSTVLAGALLLSIVALPTIISVAEDAIRATPRHLREASLALGASQWQTIYNVVIPYARQGILAAIILGVGRIVGETMVVLMVTGNNPQLVGFDLLESVRTMSAAIAAEMGEAPQGGLHYKALFAVGCLLFLLTFCINLVGELLVVRKIKQR